MPSRIVQFNNVASHGIVRDVPAIELPAQVDALAWSDGQNIRFDDGKVEKFLGESLQLSASATCMWADWAGYASDGQEGLWAYAQDGGGGANSPLRLASLISSGANALITVTAGWTGADPWNLHGCRFAPFFLINDARGRAPVFIRVTTAPSVNLLMYSTATSWDARGEGAHVIRKFGRFLVALGQGPLTQPQSDYVHWSTDAASESMPGTWAIDDTTENAGRTPLHGAGEFADLLPMGEDAIVYKQYGAWRMRFIGGNNVFDFEQLQNVKGMFWRDCGVVVDDRTHVVLGSEDIYRTDGISSASIIDKRRRRYIFDRIKRGNNAFAKVMMNHERDEVWFALPLQTALFPTIIYTYNLKDDTWGERDVSSNFMNLAGGAAGRLDEVLLSTTQRDTLKLGRRMVSVSQAGLSICDETFQLNSTVMTSYIRRTGLDFEKPGITKLLRKVWPRMTATSGSVQVRVGTQKHPEDTVTWSAYRTFTPGTDDAVTFDAKGRYHAIEFKSSADMNWTLSGFEVEIRDGGRY